MARYPNLFWLFCQAKRKQVSRMGGKVSRDGVDGIRGTQQY
jgi:hypothetical protein